MATAALMLIMLIVRRNSDISGGRFALSYILLAAISIAEMGYMIEYENPLWLCIPDDVGWSTAIISTVLFLGIILLQLFCFIVSMIDCAENYLADVNLKLGYYSLILGIIATIICVKIWEEGIGYIIMGVVAAQLIQYLLIIISCARGRNIVLSIPFIFLYSLSILVPLIAITKAISSY